MCANGLKAAKRGPHDMDRQNGKARNLREQEPGRGSRHATATCIPRIAHRDRPRHKPGTLYTVTPRAGEPFRVRIGGRDQWALDRLRAAGGKGCTPISEPAPRWSAYVFNLRSLGVEIETVTEPHGGDYPGHHARYVLRSTVDPVLEGGTP